MKTIEQLRAELTKAKANAWAWVLADARHRADGDDLAWSNKALDRAWAEVETIRAKIRALKEQDHANN